MVEKRRRNMAYRIFPIYSKNKDHVGPLSGNSSPFPRTSAIEPGMTGIRHAPAKKAHSTADIGTLLPSHLTLPCIRNVTAPSTAPITTIGCSLMRRLRKNTRNVMPFHRSSYA